MHIYTHTYTYLGSKYRALHDALCNRKVTRRCQQITKNTIIITRFYNTPRKDGINRLFLKNNSAQNGSRRKSSSFDTGLQASLHTNPNNKLISKHPN